MLIHYLGRKNLKFYVKTDVYMAFKGKNYIKLDAAKLSFDRTKSYKNFRK